MKKNVSLYSIITLLFFANVFQVYKNLIITRKLQECVQSLNFNTINNLKDNSNKEFELAEFILQGQIFSYDFNVIDLSGAEKKFSLFKNYNGLILHFKDTDCSDCNRDGLNLIYKEIRALNKSELIVLTKFQSNREFFSIINELGINEKFECLNMQNDIEALSYNSVILFYLEDNKIKYPFALNEKSIEVISSYIKFIKEIKK